MLLRLVGLGLVSFPDLLFADDQLLAGGLRPLVGTLFTFEPVFLVTRHRTDETKSKKCPEQKPAPGFGPHLWSC